MEIDWEAWAQLTPAEIEAAILDYCDEHTRGLSSDEEDEFVRTADEPLRVAHVLGWLDYEVSQNSLEGYFFNSHGRHARIASTALRRIGATAMAGVLDEAIELAGRDDASWAGRHDQLNNVPEFSVVQPFDGLPDGNLWAELGDRYWRAAERDEWGDKFESYLAGAVARRSGVSSG